MNEWISVKDILPVFFITDIINSVPLLTSAEFTDGKVVLHCTQYGIEHKFEYNPFNNEVMKIY